MRCTPAVAGMAIETCFTDAQTIEEPPMANRHTLDLSTADLAYILGTDSGLGFARYGLPSDAPWAQAVTSPVFAVYLDDRRVDGRTDGVAVREITIADLKGGARHAVAHLTYAPGQLAIEHHTVVYSDSALAETWQVVRNVGDAPARITRLDSIALDLPPDEYELMYFTGAWGLEFESGREPLAGSRTLETRAGRSSHGQHPWF